MFWDGKPYHSLDYELKKQFGQKIYKLALDGGMTCPNRDGTLGTGGCIFCSEGGSGEFAAARCDTVAEQIRTARERVEKKMGREGGKYIAYFQSYTNTYAPVPYLRQLFEEAMAHPDIVALSVGTRPDCLPGEVLDLLEELNLKKPVWVELGLQTIHEETAGLIRRGYEFPCFFQAVRELKKRGLTVVVHVILGLPGETREMMLDTVRTLADLDIHGIKLQLLHVLKGTDLEKLYETQGFPILSLEEYLDLVIDCVALLPPRLVVHRISGDGPKSLLVAPLWSGNKRMVLNAMTRRFRERGVTQGDAYEALEEKNHKKTLED